MTSTVTLASRRAAADAAQYLDSADALGVRTVRLIGAGGVLAIYSLVLSPAGVADACPTVLGVRTLVTGPTDTVDVVVPLRSLRQRLGRALEIADQPDAVTDRPTQARGSSDGRLVVGLPLAAPSVAWSSISLPRGKWRQVATVSGQGLARAARSGSEGLRRAELGDLDTLERQRTRSAVWSAGIERLGYVPVGAAWAMGGLGLLDGVETVTVHDAGPWLRLATPQGHVLARQPNWSLRP